MEMKKSIEELLQTPYWIVDILPAQVPKDSLINSKSIVIRNEKDLLFLHSRAWAYKSHAPGCR